LFSAPLFWQVWNYSSRIGSLLTVQADFLRLFADLISHAIYLAYLTYCIVGFGHHIGSWYGWVIGIAVGLVVVQILGLLWPRRWHIEVIGSQL